jgi:hypothetical protein
MFWIRAVRLRPLGSYRRCQFNHSALGSAMVTILSSLTLAHNCFESMQYILAAGSLHDAHSSSRALASFRSSVARSWRIYLDQSKVSGLGRAHRPCAIMILPVVSFHRHVSRFLLAQHGIDGQRPPERPRSMMLAMFAKRRLEESLAARSRLRAWTPSSLRSGRQSHTVLE